jgi:uncharacterized protein YbjT (DUF2867 family)
MADSLVLVTGASGGRQGQTGRHVSEMLLARGIAVRAFVHGIDERSDHLRAVGAEIVDGDFLDISSVRRAVQGVSSIYFAYPVQDGLLDATAIMAVTAHEARVSRLVNLVMLRSSLDAPTPRMRQAYLSERIFDWAGVGAVHIKAAVFYENVRALVRSNLSTDRPIRLPLGSGNTVVPLVSAEDVARLAVGLLTKASVPSGSSYPMIGAVLALRDIIATFNRVLGRDIRYEEITDEDWRSEALARGVNAHAVEHLSHLWRFFRLSGLRTDSAAFEVREAIEAHGGAKPKTFEAFVREEQRVFSMPPTSIPAQE